MCVSFPFCFRFLLKYFVPLGSSDRRETDGGGWRSDVALSFFGIALKILIFVFFSGVASLTFNDRFDNDGFLLPWRCEWIKFVYVSHLRQCSLVSVLQPSKRYKSKYLGFSVDRNEILWSQYLTCMKLCVLNFLWNMQCPRLAINSVKKEFAALNKSQGKLTSAQGNYNTSILDTWLIQNIIDICFLSQGLQW